jgi:tetratricopeptide (TPR) repeat protein
MLAERKRCSRDACDETDFSLRKKRDRSEDEMTQFCLRAELAAVFLLLPVSGSSGPQGQPPPVVQRANDEYGKGNFKEAAALYQDALNHPPPEYGEMPPQFKSYLCIQIGACYVQLNRFDEAVEVLKKSISFYEYPQAYNWLGRAYIMMPDYPEAARHYQKAIELDPESCVNYASLAIAASRSGQDDVAQKAIDGSRGKKCADDDQYALRSAQLLPLLAKGKYNDAHGLVGDSNTIGVDLKVTPEAVGILYLFQGGPAQLAGLAVGDTFEAIDGKPIHSTEALIAALDAVPFGSTAAIRINRNGGIQEKYVVVGIPPNLAELAAAVNRPFPGTEVEKTSTMAMGDHAPVTTKPSLEINRVEVKPATVMAGEPFSIEISYTATAAEEITYTYSVHTATEKLFESKPRPIQAEVGQAGLISIRQIPSTTTPGKYAIQVHLAMGAVKAEGSSALTVTKK